MSRLVRMPFGRGVAGSVDEIIAQAVNIILTFESILTGVW